MDIAQVAQRSGLTAPTLRFYEEKGLIQSIGRQGQRRIFDAGVLQTLSLIALGRVAGFSLDDIRGMLHANPGATLDRAMLLAKADEVDQSIQQLKAVRDGLRHAANCPETSHLACPTFQRLLRAATRGAIQPMTVAASKPQRT